MKGFVRFRRSFQGYMTRLALLALVICPLAAAFWAPSPRPWKSSPHFASVTVPASELDKDLSETDKVVVQTIRACGPAVGVVQVQVLGGRATGSCFCVSSSEADTSYLVTNYHVIQSAYVVQQRQDELDAIRRDVLGNADCPLLSFNSLRMPQPNVTVQLPNNSTTHIATIVQVDPTLDLALLRIATTVPVLTWSLDPPLVGQAVLALGTPLGLANSVTRGIVSALDRDIRPYNTPTTLRGCLQTDATINPGNSGGPLVLSSTGQVVGINTAGTTGGSNLGFAVPATRVAAVVDEWIRVDVAANSATKRGYLGVSIMKGDGCVVTRVEAHSPAARAGIQAVRLEQGSLVASDAIVNVNNQDIDSYQDLYGLIDKGRPGEQWTVTVEALNGERRVVYLTLEDQPGDDSAP